MKAKFKIDHYKFKTNLSKGINISIPLISGEIGPNCFWAPPYEASPVVTEGFIGSIESGGSVNFFNIKINPHGNGTHTECVGHIEKGAFYVNQCLKESHFLTELITVIPTKIENGDKVILRSQLEQILDSQFPIEALIIRTLPNDEDKKRRIYSNTNPPYIDHQAINFLNDIGIKHLVTDLPSVDREQDEGLLLSHKAFWLPNREIVSDKTITEMVYVPNRVKDGLYLLNIQIAPIQLDASPSTLIIYPVKIKA